MVAKYVRKGHTKTQRAKQRVKAALLDDTLLMMKLMRRFTIVW
jgi:hypothetical protein